MKQLLVPTLIGGALVLGLAGQPAAAQTEETVIVKRVKGLCYDSDGDRVPCTTQTTRRYYYRGDNPEYRYNREPGVGVDVNVRERRYYRTRDRDWD